ncbi:MAG: hypothetical protein BWY49_00483 [Candidatus Omnitrophica bacterium ADurb.Bin314]|nr:MAG: hypothetical protein BWY49_00483 [Candidatus Omnitrophica bacterium ADurb.Bin314]
MIANSFSSKEVGQSIGVFISPQIARAQANTMIPTVIQRRRKTFRTPW